MADPLGFYAEPARLTEASRHHELLEALPADLGELAQIISRVGIYDVVAADFYGIDVPVQRAAEIHLRSVDDMLAGVLALEEAPLVVTRCPERRLFCRCAGFTRLLVAALRAQKTPARARCGFATYFTPGHFEDHWVGEVYDVVEARWRLIDAQLDEVWRARLDLTADECVDLSPSRFLPAAEAWRRCRASDEDPERFGISFAGLHGLWFVASNLVRDLAALNKMEMLPWDVWGAQPAPDQPFGDEQVGFFDDLAELLTNPDASFDELWRRYQSDDRLRVPPQVFNALRNQAETT
jgi:hypothetical protein